MLNPAGTGAGISIANDGFAHNFTNPSALFPRDYEQKEAKMACPKRLGKPTEKYSQDYI